jgi:hypothetical protein
MYPQELRLADLGLAENCTEVREMDDGEVRDAIRGIMVGVAQSICAGALSIGGGGDLNPCRQQRQNGRLVETFHCAGSYHRIWP